CSCSCWCWCWCWCWCSCSCWCWCWCSCSCWCWCSCLCSRCSGCAMCSPSTLKLAQLGKFQKHVIRVHRPDDESRNAVADAAARNVIAQECQRRMAGELQQARATAGFLHLHGGVRRVAIDGLEVIGNIAIRVVFDLAVEATDGAVDGDRFVHVLSGPPGTAAIVEPQLIVGIPIGGANPATEMPGH